jgi:hypothetical protein
LQENQLAGAKDDHSLVLEQEECADCQQSNNEASNLLLHPNSIAVADRGKASKDALDESLCGDPLMYATFVAPVHQYSTETEPSRQVKTKDAYFAPISFEVTETDVSLKAKLVKKIVKTHGIL